MTVKAPWWPHIYVMQCIVNETMLDKLADVRAGRRWHDPEWMRDLRRGLSADTEDIEALRGRVFVKVGSTYGTEPGTRTGALSDSGAPKTTMMCRRIPVVGSRVICYIPGEEELEKLLHYRWQADRIDSTREFFWLNSEILELATLYGGYDPAPRPAKPTKAIDPFAHRVGRRRVAGWPE